VLLAIRGVGVHFVLSRCESDVTVCQYKGDSKSEQMAFIVDHRPCRLCSPMYRSCFTESRKAQYAPSLSRSVCVADVERASERENNSRCGARRISTPPTFHDAQTYVIQEPWVIAHLEHLCALADLTITRRSLGVADTTEFFSLSFVASCVGLAERKDAGRYENLSA
jgi:hypothetical protein